MENLGDKIKSRRAAIGIIGLGQVGLRLAVALAKAGYRVVGFEKDTYKASRIRGGGSYIKDIGQEEVALAVEKGLLRVGESLGDLQEIDVLIICVPTPFRKTADPDLTGLAQVVAQVGDRLRKGQAVIVESCVGIGTTEELVLPGLQKSGLIVGRDFYLIHSPERVDPGNAVFGLRNTPKIVGGVTEACSRTAKALYEEIIDQVIVVSSPRCAEAVKFLENAFRAVNIGLVNEIAMLCERLGVNVWEVIEAAATKPFGFMSFDPGPGFGGYYPFVNGAYLVSRRVFGDYKTRLVGAAEAINAEMCSFVVSKIEEGLSNNRKSINGSRILILGVTYKRNVSDYNESPALDIMTMLHGKGAEVFFHDPYVRDPPQGCPGRWMDLTLESLKDSDCVTIIADHDGFDYGWIIESSSLVMDARGVTRALRRDKANVITI